MKKLILSVACLATSALFGGSAKEFLRESMGEDYRLKSYKGTDFIDGGSSAKIHFVTRNREPVAVLKQYDQTIPQRRMYEAERKAYEELGMRSDADLNAPALFVAGEDDEHCYLIMDIAKGEAMNRIMQDVKKGKLKIDELYAAIEESSRLLRQFHDYSGRTNLKKNYFRIHSTNRIIMNGLDELPEEDFDTLKLREHHDKLLNRFMASNAAIGQVHGDMHPGNAFYDPKTNTVSMIDFSSVNQPAQNNEGEFIARDAMKYLFTLQISAFQYGYSQEEIDTIEQAFFNGYGRDKLKQSEMEYFKFYYAIDMIDAYGKEEKKLYAFCKNSLNKQISNADLA